MRGDGMGALRSAASPRNISSGFKNIGNLFSPERDFGRTFGNISGREGGVDFSKNYEKPVGKPNFYQKYLSPNRESVTNNNVDNLTKLTSTEAYKKGGDATRAALIEKFAKTTEPSLFKQYGPLAGLGLGALYAGGAFDVKEEEEIDKETGQDLIDANPEEYLIAGLDPYRGAPGPVRVATDYPLFAAKGGAMGNVFPRRTGGIMPDEGIPNKDSVKAMVMPGEFILTTDAVKGAGNGDLNRGINNLYGVMRNLENIGRRAS